MSVVDQRSGWRFTFDYDTWLNDVASRSGLYFDKRIGAVVVATPWPSPEVEWATARPRFAALVGTLLRRLQPRVVDPRLAMFTYFMEAAHAWLDIPSVSDDPKPRPVGQLAEAAFRMHDLLTDYLNGLADALSLTALLREFARRIRGALRIWFALPLWRGRAAEDVAAVFDRSTESHRNRAPGSTRNVLSCRPSGSLR
jgi:hypothetical protein